MEERIIFDVPPAKEGKTGTCVVLTTPDADRTMLTNLGISTSLTKNDIHEKERLKDSQITSEGIFMGRAKYEK